MPMLLGSFTASASTFANVGVPTGLVTSLRQVMTIQAMELEYEAVGLDAFDAASSISTYLSTKDLLTAGEIPHLSNKHTLLAHGFVLTLVTSGAGWIQNVVQLLPVSTLQTAVENLYFAAQNEETTQAVTIHFRIHYTVSVVQAAAYTDIRLADCC